MMNNLPKWYNFADSSNSEVAVINIFGDIGWDIWLSQFMRDLAELGPVSTIKVNIASDGGYITEGVAMYNLLRMHAAAIEVEIISHAYSMGSLVAMAGDVVKMASNATFMIHEPWNYAGGNADEHRKNADVLDTFAESMVNSYVKKTGKSADEVRSMMKAETWMTADQAKDHGFVDEITDSLDIAASLDRSKYKASKIPDFAMQHFNKKSTQPKEPKGMSDKDKPEGNWLAKLFGVKTEADAKKELENIKAQLDVDKAAAIKAAVDSAMAKFEVDKATAITTAVSATKTEQQELAKNIFEACKIAGRQSMAGELIANGSSLEEAKAAIEKANVDNDDETGIDSSHMSDSSGVQAVTVSPVIAKLNAQR